MSSPTPPAQGLSGLPMENHSATGSGTGIGDVGAFIAQLAAGVSALNIEAWHGGPPPEVLDQIVAAGRIGEQLREAGHELRFFTPAEGGRLRIEIHDRDGNPVGTISLTAALELAAGSPLN